jgi:hypothetical protein
MCKKCCDRKFVVPSYVIVKGDFEAHSICQPCENHLQKHLHTPCLEFNRMTKAAIKSVGKARVEAIKAIRDEGLRLLYYHILPTCPSRHTMISLIPQNITPYLSVYPDSVGARLSLADLCELQTQYPQRAMSQVVQLFANHVARCPSCSAVRRVCCGGEYCSRKGQHNTPAAGGWRGLGGRRGSTSNARLPPRVSNGTLVLASTHSPTPPNRLSSGAGGVGARASRVPLSPSLMGDEVVGGDEVGGAVDADGLVDGDDWGATTAFSPYRPPPVTIAPAASNTDHPAATADGTELLADDAMVLCRTCSEYCHEECYLRDETQCRRCAAEMPDVMPFVRHFSKRSFGDETALLWDCCEEDWFGMDELSHRKREGKRRASVLVAV